ncbi:MAG: hypothetical protein HY810_09925 [Candidatus Omnitrophica bacterium]|nr:hypothetical protein [Candidatus Omnitrophota bacterium]
MEQNNKFLTISVVIFKVFAWVSTVFFLIIAIAVLLGAGGPDTPRVASLIFILGGAMYFLVLFSIAEAFRVLINLSEKVEKISALLSGKSS